MEDSDVNFLFLGSEDNFVEIFNPPSECALQEWLNKLYEPSDAQADYPTDCAVLDFNDRYNEGQNDRAVLAKWKTNARYQISEVPVIPIFGYKQVEISPGGLPVILLSNEYTNIEDFMQAFSQIIWVTYRYGFEPIEYKDKIFTSDTGWGCTIRVGQMLLLNCLKLHFNTNLCSLLEVIQENLVVAPFSLHKIVKYGVKFDKSPGDWYSPSLISHVLQGLTEEFSGPGLRVQVFMDSLVYKSMISRSGSTLVLIPLMLGIGDIQEEYYETLKFLLGLRWSVGIIGGIPKSALYIVGYQGNELLFLDPHLVQPACTSGQDMINKMSTYQCLSPKLLPLASAESSISVGMYFREFKDFEEFEEKMKENEEVLHGVINIKDWKENEVESRSESEEEYYMV